MKKLLICLSVFALSASFTAFADDDDWKTPKGYSQLTMGYGATFMDNDENSYYDTNFDGLVLQYIRGIHITRSLPMYIETGARTVFGFGQETETWHSSSGYYHSVTTNKYIGSLEIPVNLAYRFSIGSTHITLTPYSGFNFKFNLYGYDRQDGGAKHDYFDNPDKASRFQLGWAMGGKFVWKKLIAGMEYNVDFNKYSKHMNSSTFMLTMGLNLDMN